MALNKLTLSYCSGTLEPKSFICRSRLKNLAEIPAIIGVAIAAVSLKFGICCSFLYGLPGSMNTSPSVYMQQHSLMMDIITLTSKWPRWRLKSPASRLFTQPLIQTQIKENIKAPRHWPLCGEFTGTGEFPAQRASYAENVSIWWRHHDLYEWGAYLCPSKYVMDTSQLYLSPDFPIQS